MCIKKICKNFKISDQRRFKWFLGLFFSSLLFLIVILSFLREKFFFNAVINNYSYTFRFFWILPFSFIGFSFLVFMVSKDSPPHNWRCFCGKKTGKEESVENEKCIICGSQIVDFVERDKPWRSYLFYYIPKLIAVSLIIFAVLHLFGVTSGYIYYFFSVGLGLFFGYNVEEFKLEKLKIF